MDEEQFYEGDDFAEDAEFHDGPTGDEGQPYMALNLPAWALAPPPEPEPEPAPVRDKPLLTAEEFMAKYNLTPPTPGTT